MLVYSPGGSFAGFTWYGWSKSSLVSPKLYPALNAAMLLAFTRSLKRPSIHSIVGSVGREYSHDTTPNAKKFFDRSESRAFTPNGSVASRVSVVIGISTTR